MSLLRKSLQNYTKARSASNQSQSFSDANSQKENVSGRPVPSTSVDDGAVSSKQPGHTPTSGLAPLVATTPTAPLQSFAAELSQNTVRRCAKVSAVLTGTERNSDTTCYLQPLSASNSDRVRCNHTVSILHVAYAIECSTHALQTKLTEFAWLCSRCCSLQGSMEGCWTALP